MFVSINKALDASRAKREDNEGGFTLIELLVVVLIIGILAAIAIPVFIGQQNKAKDSAVQSDLANAKTALISAETNNSGVLGATTMAELKTNGFTPTDGTTNFIAYGDASAFCLQETSATGNVYFMTDSSGVQGGVGGETPSVCTITTPPIASN